MFLLFFLPNLKRACAMYGCLPQLFVILHQPQYPSIVIVVMPVIDIMEDQASERNYILP